MGLLEIICLKDANKQAMLKAALTERQKSSVTTQYSNNGCRCV